LEVSCPKRPLLHPHFSNLINGYGHRIRSELEEVTRVDEPLLNRVLELIENQYTLKKSLFNLESSLKKYGVSLFSRPAEREHISALNLAYLLVLEQLHLKYELKQPIRSCYLVINELCDLICDKVISFEEVLESLFIFTDVIERSIENNYAKIDFSNPYKLLLDKNKMEILLSQGTCPSLDDAVVIAIGSKCPTVAAFRIGETEDFMRDITNVLINLWEQGMPIAWERYAEYFLAGRTTVTLPNYPFEKKEFWVSSTV